MAKKVIDVSQFDDLRAEMHHERLTRTRPALIIPSDDYDGLYNLVLQLSGNTSTSIELNPNELDNLAAVIAAWKEAQHG